MANIHEANTKCFPCKVLPSAYTNITFNSVEMLRDTQTGRCPECVS